MDGITIQGVRAYDPTSAQWTSPDAYSGDVNDPMSQKPFMWNNNNPLAYEDPSGYEGSCAGCQGMDPFSNPIPPNIDAYAKAEVHLGPVTVAVTADSKSVFVSVGGAATKAGIASLKTMFTRGTVSAGASVNIGVVLPKAGRTADDVINGGSLGASGGAGGVGAEVFGNSSGFAAGAGLSTPGLTPFGYGVGQQVYTAPTGSSTTKRSAPHRKPYRERW